MEQFLRFLLRYIGFVCLLVPGPKRTSALVKDPDTGSGGIRYVVFDAQAVQDLAKTRQVAIEQPLSKLACWTILMESPIISPTSAVSGRQRAGQKREIGSGIGF
jgi:hypothetical protein